MEYVVSSTFALVVGRRCLVVAIVRLNRKGRDPWTVVPISERQRHRVGDWSRVPCDGL
ncbi:hypothetical protein chiPu_0026817, partial [Chiloscyllium punctatum]|nr:hypothetical protein [Chiloscyllium punctatum]